MNPAHLTYLACPRCQADLVLRRVDQEDARGVGEGLLACTGCGAEYPIVRHVPRFVPGQNYADNFGLQWNRYARLQYDSFLGLPLSRRRFFITTGWPERLPGEVILEAGGGGGRFSEVVVTTGAMVVSFDLSSAVDANYELNGHNPNLLIVQADIYAPPVRDGFFDRVFCLGVLQHTPRVRDSFRVLAGKLKPGGSLAVDVYAKHKGGRYQDFFNWLGSYRRMRFITRHLPPRLVHALWRRYVEAVWPLIRWLWRRPRGRKYSQRIFLVKDYLKHYEVPEEVRKQWAIMNGIDGLCARYENRQSLATMERWFREAGFTAVEVFYGPNGVNARGRAAGGA